MIAINISLGILILLLGYSYFKICKDINKMQDDIYKLKKELSRDGIQKLQGDVEKLQIELKELDVRRYSGDSQLTEWLKAISNKLKTLSHD